MSNNQSFFICEHCGNLVGLVEDHGVPLVCCGQPMQALVPNTAEAATEKHLPVVRCLGDVVQVTVGSVQHPMEAAHHIGFVYLQTTHGGQRKNLQAGEPPVVAFALTEDQPLAAYAFCNLHGLWKTEIS